ncbi:SRPBCC domain-containing protein [Brevibacterium sp. 2SA]|uniref:ArsR/SmtB family transcription factor n=1 Tax=Brevibacterium sp. 2SA TaxID=2502198 RepID=UPI0010F7CB2E|nr:SRPBCC domain-containing protein [Brevibacterium sp. 2SA]
MATSDDDQVLLALSQPSRRALLDALHDRDGQSVSELGQVLPALGRHAVLKHVGVLEDAGLVTSHKAGRIRHCYLNAAPLVALAHRWLDDYALEWGQALNQLKSTSERRPEIMSTTTPLHRHAIVIDASPERVWTALTEESSSWYFTTTLNSSLEPGTAYTYPDGRTAAEGTIIATEPGHRLEMTFSPVWDDAVAPEASFRLVWSLESRGRSTLVTIEHFDLDPSTETARQVDHGSLVLISNLKTWIETGAPMHS